MEAARTAALRGHEVDLYEMTGELGGQVRMAASVPPRSDMEALTRWQAETQAQAETGAEAEVINCLSVVPPLQSVFLLLSDDWSNPDEIDHVNQTQSEESL